MVHRVLTKLKHSYQSTYWYYCCCCVHYKTGVQVFLGADNHFCRIFFMNDKKY